MPSLSKPALIQYWHEPEPPGYIAELLDSFAEENPEMEHMVFNDATAAEFIAAHYGARELAAFRACGVPAMRADYLRYCACHALGGICVDADYRCTGPLLPTMESGVAGQLFKARRNGVLINSCFGFRDSGHPLLGLVLDISTTLIEQRFAGRVSEVTGPGLFTVLYHVHRFPARSNEDFLRHLEAAAEPEADSCAVPDDGIVTVLRQPQLRDLTARMVDVIESRDRLERAFEGVRVSPGRAIRGLVQQPELASTPYKHSADDWNRAGTRIYREAESDSGIAAEFAHPTNLRQ